MTRSPFRRLVFGTLRRLLYLWVRSETINQSSLTLNLDRSRPVFYVLQSPSLTELAVVDAECTKAGLPRPVLPVSVGPLMEPAAFFYLTPEPDWLGRQDKRGAPPTLTRLVNTLTEHAEENAQIIPVSVFWGAITRERVQPVETAVCRQLGRYRPSAPTAEYPDPRSQDPCAILCAHQPA